jgi:hypothetical protein
MKKALSGDNQQQPCKVTAFIHSFTHMANACSQSHSIYKMMQGPKTRPSKNMGPCLIETTRTELTAQDEKLCDR